MMAPYFVRKYFEYVMKCPLPMPARTPPTTLAPAQTSTALLEEETTLDPKPDENLTTGKELTTAKVISSKQTAMSFSTKGKISEDRVRSQTTVSHNRFTFELFV
jgi:hypothetical protein